MYKYSACCFMGLRPAGLPFIESPGDPRYAALERVLTAQISGRIREGCVQFLSGVSRGVDMLCAETVVRLRPRAPGIRLVCVISHEEQAARWNEQVRNRYFTLLEQADHTIYTGRRATPTSGCERDRYLVDHADQALAVYPDLGAPAYGLSYARRQGRRIILIHPDTLAVERIPGLRDRIGLVRDRP